MASNKEEVEPKKGSGIKKILFLVIGVVVLMGGGFVFVQVAIPKTPSEDEPVEVQVELVEEKFELPMLFVNLAETQGKRFLKVGVTFQFSAAKPAAELARFETEATLIKDGLITLLSGKTLEQIDGAENKRLLKGEIREVLGKTLYPDPKQGSIDKVYYHEFLVQ